MEDSAYLDFELRIEKKGAQYRATVVHSPCGESSANFRFLRKESLENFILKLGITPQSPVRKIRTEKMESAREFGRRLFEAVFRDDVMACLVGSKNEARNRGLGLRLKLRLEDAPDLINVPWEFLYDPSLGRFLALFENTPIVRFLEIPEKPTPLKIAPPISILVMIASPEDYPRLDTEKEQANLKRALGELEKGGLIRITWIKAPARPTLPVLREYLEKGRYPIFHFIGHGGFDERGQDGLLVMEDDRAHGSPTSGERLAVLLGNHPDIRVVVLNACESARTSAADPFAGVASTLVRTAGVPAVVAMQLPISDEAAIEFTRGFYGGLALGRPVDSAVTAARLAIFTAGNDIEWATPVLYMRAPDGKIFDIAADPNAYLASLYQQAADKSGSGDRTGALSLWEQIQALNPTFRDVPELIEKTSRERDLAGWLERGRAGVESGEWQSVIEKMDQVLEAFPGQPEAQRLRAEASLGSLYQQSTEKLAAGDRAGALALLQQIHSLNPAYRDANELIKKASAEEKQIGSLSQDIHPWQREERQPAVKTLDQTLSITSKPAEEQKKKPQAIQETGKRKSRINFSWRQAGLILLASISIYIQINSLNSAYRITCWRGDSIDYSFLIYLIPAIILGVIPALSGIFFGPWIPFWGWVIINGILFPMEGPWGSEIEMLVGEILLLAQSVLPGLIIKNPRSRLTVSAAAGLSYIGILALVLFTNPECASYPNLNGVTLLTAGLTILTYGVLLTTLSSVLLGPIRKLGLYWRDASLQNPREKGTP